MSGIKFQTLGCFILVLISALCVSCTAQPITAPAVITSPGMYELTADARGITDIYGIRIEASDVVLDGQGHFLGGDQRDNSVGIYVNKFGGSITNVTIKNLKLEDWNSGVSYQYVKGKEGDTNVVSNLDILDCPTGIHIEYSDVISIIDNLIRDCSKAINIEQTSSQVTVQKNILKNNGVGIIVMKTTDVTLHDNTITTCDVYGVQVIDSSGITITKNGISDNKYAALQIESTTDSVITDNNFSKTSTGPVVVIGNGVRGAKIYNNYFGSVNNISVDDISSDIVWNTTLEVGVNILGGPYKGGNYWGSAPGLDGFSDTVPDEDGYGIGDKPFEINSYNIDYLPLTNTDKNAPAPTPEPAQQVSSESGEEAGFDVNNTSEEENVATNETSLEFQAEEVNQSESDLSNTTINETVNTSPVRQSSTPPISVQNEHQEEESVFSALGSEVVRVKDENGTVISTNTTTNGTQVTNEEVKNGYLLFTGLKPESRVVLITNTLKEVVLDTVMTSSLSVPVPADLRLYTSWKVLVQNETSAEGSIDRYPAADETVMIAVNTTEHPVTENTTHAAPALNNPAVLILPEMAAPASVLTVNESAATQNNTTPFPVTPPVLPYLPEPRDVNGTDTPAGRIVIENAAGKLVPGHTVTAYAGPGGAIFPEGTVEVMAGEDITFVVTPYEGHEIEYLLIDGSNVDPAPEYLFANVTRDHTIIAGFTKVG
ncbi:NosD domain-containing protein [Methanospirillum sp.]|uniref:NosD domain-containing protein n=1 Tax=Methanospirillum sp. TaxID=45200 RepID=UPI002BC48319|nr:NosD domain-containing protein [Methanospirillum sp.]HPP78558.1 NosD domain-containing protein [Methanospirillum sp.]